jgi:hypothetical protein
MLANYTPVQDWSDGEGQSFSQGSCNGVDGNNAYRKTIHCIPDATRAKRVFYLKPGQESVVLDPCIVLESCSRPGFDGSLFHLNEREEFAWTIRNFISQKVLQTKPGPVRDVLTVAVSKLSQD